ncbi:MAG TPA: GNAT family N-acetyltransferase [Vicinamibacterales bacterium]
MPTLAAADGPLLDQVLHASYDIWSDGLTPAAYGRWWSAQLGTPWGRSHLGRTALVDGPTVLASAKEYWFDAVLDARPLRVIGIGAVFTQPAHRGKGAATTLVDQLLGRAAGQGADLALLFSEIGPGYYARLGFAALPMFDLEMRVTESTRHGAPATLVRAGDDRDFAAIVAMNQVRATPFRFHLNRDRDLVSYAVTKKRLLAGLGPSGARELQFFVAEEGAEAVAYVVITGRDGQERREGNVQPIWTIEECGDRDPAGARVGAILQVLLAREPTLQRPTIRGWLPATLRPPQVTIARKQPASDVMMVRPLTSAAAAAVNLCEDDLLYWRADVF